MVSRRESNRYARFPFRPRFDVTLFFYGEALVAMEDFVCILHAVLEMHQAFQMTKDIPRSRS